MMKDSWSPEQYERFKKERTRPFFDLIDRIQSKPHMRVLDVGCGTGEHSRLLHDRLQPAWMLGIDRSGSMLAKSEAFAADTLVFEQHDAAAFEWTGEPFDLIVSNAVFQWIPDNPRLFEKLTGMLAPGGQIAVQVPANHDHPTHRASERVAALPEFAEKLGGYVRLSHVLEPEGYAALLHELGFVEQNVTLNVYPHLMPNRQGLVEWVKGSLLTDYESRLSSEDFADFLAAYKRELFAQVGPDKTPFFYPFKRTLLWGCSSTVL